MAAGLLSLTRMRTSAEGRERSTARTTALEYASVFALVCLGSIAALVELIDPRPEN